jgi:hypothetical protein
MCRNVARIVVADVSVPAKLYMVLVSLSWDPVKGIYTFEKQLLSELLSV